MNIKFLNLFLLVGVLCGSSVASHAQIGTMKWRFKTGTEVGPALQKARGNLRQTYEVIVCAGRQGYSSNALKFYEDVVYGKDFTANAKDSAAYAFAFDVGHSFRPWNWKRDRNPVATKSSYVSVYHLRERSAAALRSSPEALIMYTFYGMTSTAELRKRAYEKARRAVQLAPRWTDAYYWLGLAAEDYALVFLDLPKTQTNKNAVLRLAKVQMWAYDKAEKLNPTLKSFLGLDRANACELIADKEAARMMPIYVDTFLKAYPSYIVWHKARFGQDEETLRQEWATRVALVRKRADHIAD